MSSSSTTTRSERPIVDAALFTVLAFLITWGTGMLIVLSTHANLVNGAHQVEHPIPLPFPVAIALVMIGVGGARERSEKSGAERSLGPKCLEVVLCKGRYWV